MYLHSFCSSVLKLDHQVALLSYIHSNHLLQKSLRVTCFFFKILLSAGDIPEHVTLIEAVSLCDEQGVNWSLPVIQTEEDHQSLVRFMMEHNISSAWLGWQNIQLNNWTWIDGQICK